MKRKALDDPVGRPSKIIKKNLKQNDVDKLYYDLKWIRKNIHHARTSIMPGLPKNQNCIKLVLVLSDDE